MDLLLAQSLDTFDATKLGIIGLLSLYSVGATVVVRILMTEVKRLRDKAEERLEAQLSVYQGKLGPSDSKH